MNRGFLRMLCKIAFGSVMENHITNKEGLEESGQWMFRSLFV